LTINATLRFLDDFRRLHPADEKIIIVRTFSAGRQLGQALAAGSGGWLNFRFLTLPALAVETAGSVLQSNGQRLLTEEEILDLIESVLVRLRSEKELKYFGGVIPVRSLARIVRRSVEDLRQAGVQADGIDPGSFEVEEKGRELILILKAFEEALVRAGGLDLPGLYQAAVQAAGRRNNIGRDARLKTAEDGKAEIESPFYMCFEGFLLTRLERELLAAVSAGKLVLVPGDRVFGLAPVREKLRLPFSGDGGQENRNPASDIEKLAWLFEPGSSPPPAGDDSVSMFRSAGPSNECREVLRRLMAWKIPLDRAEVIYPPGGRHAAVLHLLARRQNLHLTFADGLPLNSASAGRVFFGLLDWIETNYRAAKLAELFETGDIPASLPGHRAGMLLLQAGVGWGRERYTSCLEALELEYRGRLENASEAEDSGDDRDTIEDTLREIGLLRDSVKRIIDFLPEIKAGGLVDLNALCLSIGTILRLSRAEKQNREGSAFGYLDQEGFEAAGALLRRILGPEPAGQRLVDLADALDRLRRSGDLITVGKSPPRPGHLHVSNFLSGGLSGRQLTFVVGLDEVGCPGRDRQDPVLLDEERRKISPYLETSSDRLRYRLFNMAGLLSSLRGKAVLSYPYFDVIEDRQIAPSPVLLQVLRLIEGNPALDYRALEAWFSRSEGAESGFVPGEAVKALDEMDWWLSRLAPGKAGREVASIIKKEFPSLEAGIRALSERSGPPVTEYDGLVAIDAARYDPRLNRKLAFSATRLEKLASCPYAYFLRYILGIEPPETLEFDPGTWLDPLHRGSLLHRIFCDFMRRMVERGETISLSAHYPEVLSIAGQLMEEYKKKIPPPSERVFEYERRKIIAALNIFLKVEAARPGAERPIELEKEFEVLFDLGRPFRLAGFIDRIDRVGPGRYRVIDYKTGGSARYENLREFGRGLLLQPALYAFAVEKLFRGLEHGSRIMVQNSGYFFPTEKGEGRELMLEGFNSARLGSLLGDLLDILAGGLFMPAADAACSYCEYARICGRAPGVIKNKARIDPDKFLLIGRVRGYD